MEPTEIPQRQAALIKLMRANGSLKSPRVEAAFREVPRHSFLPDEPLDKVYDDVAIMVKKNAEGRWTSSSSQPSMMAIMLEQLDLQPGMRVLEIGTGSGYNAALMAEIVGDDGLVVTVDIQPDLIDTARKRLSAAGYGRVHALAADGALGCPPFAPYDRIILTVASWVITPAWREQLIEGGRLVLPLDLNAGQKSVAFERQGDDLIGLSLYGCGFMTLQGSFAAPEPHHLTLDPEEKLQLTTLEPLPVDPTLLARWLEQPGPALNTGVRLPAMEALSELIPWLMLHTRQVWAMLTVTGDLALQRGLPVLFAWGGERMATECRLIVGPDGGAALVRLEHDNLPWIDWSVPDEERAHDQPFTLAVCPLGAGQALAELLDALARDWAAAGRPGTAQMQIRAIPAGRPVDLAPGELLIDRPYTQIVLKYA